FAVREGASQATDARTGRQLGKSPRQERQEVELRRTRAGLRCSAEDSHSNSIARGVRDGFRWTRASVIVAALSRFGLASESGRTERSVSSGRLLDAPHAPSLCWPEFGTADLDAFRLAPVAHSWRDHDDFEPHATSDSANAPETGFVTGGRVAGDRIDCGSAR